MRAEYVLISVNVGRGNEEGEKNENKNDVSLREQEYSTRKTTNKQRERK